MYQKVLVPLDRSVESEGVLDVIPDLVSADGQATLLSVIPPGRTRSLGELVVWARSRKRKTRPRNGLSHRIANRLKDSSVQATTAVVVHDSVASAIVAFANRNSVDLISMFTHDRRGLAKLVKGSVAREVERRAVMPVRVFRPEDLAAGASQSAARPSDEFDYSTVDVFARLTREQIATVVALGKQDCRFRGRHLGRRRRSRAEPVHHPVGRGPVDGAIGNWTDCRPSGRARRVLPPGGPAGRRHSYHRRFRSERHCPVADSPRPAARPMHPGRGIGRGIYAATAQLFANRYSRTLTQLGMSATREMQRDSEEGQEDQ